MKKIAIGVMLLIILALTFVSLASTRVMASVPKPLLVRLESMQDNGATSNRGQIVFAGTSYSLPSDILKIAGNYSIRYDPASDYEFVQWDTSGGLGISNHHKSETLATVSGNGTLRAIYKTRPPPSYKIYLESEQDDGSTINLGRIVFAGSSYLLPNVIPATAGTHSISYSPAVGYGFVRWETLAGVAVADLNARSTTATVSNTGTLIAVYNTTSGPIITLSPEISTGQTFKVDIMALNVTDLYAWEAKVTFDPNVLQCKGVEEGPLLGAAVHYKIETLEGVIKLNQTLLGDVPGVSGSGVLASVTFEVVEPENSTINANVTLTIVDENASGIEIILDTTGYFIPTHDVAVKSVTIDGLTATPRSSLPGTSKVYAGWPIEVMISNLGNYNETVNVTLSVTAPGYTDVDGYGPVALSPETDGTILFHIKDPPELAGLKYYANYTVKIEAAIDAPETLDGHSLLENNVCVFGDITVCMPGDVNGDKAVNLKDVFEVAKAFGTRPGDPRWNANADIEGDDTINLKDIFKLAKNFGKTYP